MGRNLAIGILIGLGFLVTGSSATEQTAEVERGWRSSYEGKNIPMDALADFDEIAGRLGEMLGQLETEGKLDANTKSEIATWFENTEEEYMDRWFGDEGKFTIRFSSRGSSQSINNNYDREFRERTRSSAAKER